MALEYVLDDHRNVLECSSEHFKIVSESVKWFIIIEFHKLIAVLLSYNYYFLTKICSYIS
jgi:hypothetical protein